MVCNMIYVNVIFGNAIFGEQKGILFSENKHIILMKRPAQQ